jgi:hypothetical protein
MVNGLARAASPLFSDDVVEAPAVSCREASPERGSHCAQLEAQILSSTVRVYFETWVVTAGEDGYMMSASVGHATVKDGRYLVTHNHTGIPLSIRERAGDPDSYTQVFLYDAAGELRHKGPLSDFSIVVEDMETLVLAHKEENYLGALGFRSAAFKSCSQLELAVGMEVAQIDWDGESSRVDWVPVSDFIVDTGVSRIILADGAKVGASGGGIFLQGFHIANNWRIEEKLDNLGNVISQISTAALNSQTVADVTSS